MGFPTFLAPQGNSRLTAGFPGLLHPEALLGFFLPSRVSAHISITGLSMGFPTFLAPEGNSRLTAGFPGLLHPEALLGFLLAFQGFRPQKHYWAFYGFPRISGPLTLNSSDDLSTLAHMHV